MKKRLLKIVLGIVAGFVLFVGVALAYVKWALPNVGSAPALTLHPTAAQIAHGKYLAHHVAGYSCDGS
jgi:hypothetical protein